jgi:hypothetical protein
VHPELSKREKTPPELIGKKIWDERFKDIRHFEQYLARNGVVVRKFFLHVSKKEQKRRFLERIDNLEVFGQRRCRARLLGRLHESVPRNDSENVDRRSAVVCRAGR